MDEKNIKKDDITKEAKPVNMDSELENLRGYVLEAINEKDEEKDETDIAEDKVTEKTKNKGKVLPSVFKKKLEAKITPVKGDAHLAGELLKTTKTSTTKKILKYVLLFLFIIILLIFFLGMGIYYFKLDNKFFNFLIEKTPLPVALVGSDFILYKDYNIVKAASLNSLDKESEIEKNAEMISEVETNILNRLIDIKMIDGLAKEYNVFLTDEEIKSSLDDYIKEAGSEEEFKNILNDLYLWDIDDFQEKLLKPFLLERKLNNYLAWSDDFNQDKKAQAEKVLSVLPANMSENQFIEAVEQYSEDYTTIQSGGYLDQFGRGAMVKEFEDAAFSLPVGGVSGITRTAYGFHIIMVTGKNETEDLITARHILITAHNLKDALEMTRNNTKITKLIK